MSKCKKSIKDESVKKTRTKKTYWHSVVYLEPCETSDVCHDHSSYAPQRNHASEHASE